PDLVGRVQVRTMRRERAVLAVALARPRQRDGVVPREGDAAHQRRVYGALTDGLHTGHALLPLGREDEGVEQRCDDCPDDRRHDEWPEEMPESAEAVAHERRTQ